MNREKQIEEMAKDLAIERKCPCEDTPACKGCFNRGTCFYMEIAEILVAKGYRKASDVVSEVLGTLYKGLVYHLENVNNEYMKLPSRSTHTAYYRGAATTVNFACNAILELEKRYTEKGK